MYLQTQQFKQNFVCISLKIETQLKNFNLRIFENKTIQKYMSKQIETYKKYIKSKFDTILLTRITIFILNLFSTTTKK